MGHVVQEVSDDLMVITLGILLDLWRCTLGGLRDF